MPRAVLCVKNGDPTLPLDAGVLKLEPNYILPRLKPGQLRIAVAAASVNYADLLTVTGKYQVKMPLPFVPGAEVAGSVTEVTENSAFQPGDKVVSFHQGGAFADELIAPEVTTWSLPDNVDLGVAAAVPVVYGTADLALRHRAQLQAGQTVLVLGAGGGVGLAALHIAKLVGAVVIAVTQGASKVALLKSQGADIVIDLAECSKERPLHSAIKQCAPRGVHVVIDPVGGSYFSAALKAVAWGAHVVVIGFAAGSIPQVPANILLVKNTTLHGLFWGSYLLHDPKVLRSSMDDIMGWLSEGRLKPHISHTFPLEQLPLAFAALLERRVMGKVTVQLGGAPGGWRPKL